MNIKNIKQLRQQKGVSQFRLSTQLNIPVSRISRHESGYILLSENEQNRIIHFLETSPDALKVKPWMNSEVQS
jgi:DNA-binding transcriptional regulator YiaG